ncbi:hypothetical protein AcV7_005099 [Taiwanofungus camphoratus]|nr:hypothetical protein AcV7_005099 [Antrodia cinnamomea]
MPTDPHLAVTTLLDESQASIHSSNPDQAQETGSELRTASDTDSPSSFEDRSNMHLREEIELQIDIPSERCRGVRYTRPLTNLIPSTRYQIRDSR